MFIRSLTIASNATVIRDIEFKKGLNIIVDETPPEPVRESGNNVGKTTVLRLVNYCFGADAKRIYSDPEFKEKEDPAVKEYLENNDIVVRLSLSRDLSFGKEDDIVIERNFLKRAEKTQKINGVSYIDNEEFKKELKKAIFDSDVKHPTIKQIVAKSIREGGRRTENCVKVLDSFAKASDYELLFLFWLGIEIEDSSKKGMLETQRKAEEALLKKLAKEATESQIEQALKVLDREIEELEKLRATFNVNSDYEKDLGLLDEARRSISSISTKLSALDLAERLLQDSIDEVKKERSGIEADTVRSLYQEARSLIPDVQKTFEETLAFHNKMVAARLSFLEQSLPKIRRQIDELKSELDRKLAQEVQAAERLKVSDAFEMIEDVVIRLNEAHERKGYYESSREIRAAAQTRLENIKANLSVINAGISSNKALIEERIAAFNEIFSTRSHEMYGESSILSSDWGSGKLSLEISSVGENPGMGKKLGQIALFDLSLISFSDAEGIKCLHFVMQDRMEAVHDNQLTTLYEIIDKTNCQYILTALENKIPRKFVDSGKVVLRLSQEDKLFRIP